MSDDLELEAIERRIADLGGVFSAEGVAKLQRLYLERERIHEKQFKASIERRAKLAKRSERAKGAPK